MNSPTRPSWTFRVVTHHGHCAPTPYSHPGVQVLGPCAACMCRHNAVPSTLAGLVSVAVASAAVHSVRNLTCTAKIFTARITGELFLILG